MMLMSAMSLNAAVTVDRIEPTNWYVGMKDASLQLMVYGKDVRNAEVEVNYPGVRIDSIARLDSPNYLLVYLNLEGAKAGEMTMSFKQGKQTKKVKYQLKDRAMAGDKRIGFSNEDVLYMLTAILRTTLSRTCATRHATARLQVCATEATLKVFASISTTSTSLELRHCGSHRFLRTTVRAMA